MRCDAGDPGGCPPLSRSVVFAPDQGCQEFGVKGSGFVAKSVMRSWWLVFAQETRCYQAISQIFFPDFERERDGNIGIEGEQWFVGYGQGERMKSKQPLCPAANDNDLGQPRIESIEELA